MPSELEMITNLIKVHGRIITEPEPMDPMPTDWGTGTIDEQVGRLFQWQANHSWFARQIVIDGNKLGQPGIDPPLRFMTAGGKLALEPGAETPPAPVVQTLQPPPAVMQTVTIAPPASGQVITRGAGPTTFVLPGQTPSAHRFFRVAPQIGGDTVGGELIVKDGSGKELARHPAVDKIEWSVMQQTADVPLAIASDTLVIEMPNPTVPWLADYFAGKP